MLIWSLVNTVNLVMLACVEIFKKCVTTNPALLCAPRSPTDEKGLNVEHFRNHITINYDKSSSACID